MQALNENNIEGARKELNRLNQEQKERAATLSKMYYRLSSLFSANFYKESTEEERGEAGKLTTILLTDREKPDNERMSKEQYKKIDDSVCNILHIKSLSTEEKISLRLQQRKVHEDLQPLNQLRDDGQMQILQLEAQIRKYEEEHQEADTTSTSKPCNTR